MSPRRPDVSEQVLQFAPKEKTPRNPGDELDQAGQAIVELLQQAANLSSHSGVCSLLVNQPKRYKSLANHWLIAHRNVLSQ